VHQKEKDGDEKLIWKCNDYKKLRLERVRVHTQSETTIEYLPRSIYHNISIYVTPLEQH